ncbi:vWA domain-containing protein [Halomarina pelagica]|uniref:vWA domain-containing protein n=1 Tax=Halomarina pelagica TaxID=2961599 RepID=UPI0020C2CACD|nr:VWA domain-containing protein [Halomarina sp. BND7]
MSDRLLPLATAVLLVLAGCSGAAPGGDGGGASGGSAVGLAVGGAQDVNDFRNNVHEGYLPHPGSLTAEGLFHDYYFETGGRESCERLFCPSYARAVSRDPLSNETERYLAVGLNSGIESFERPPLNLVVVLDTSGSMDAEMTEYYYDNGTASSETRSKLAVARESVLSLTAHLDEDDRFGLVTYSDDARVVHELRSVGETNLDGLRDRVSDVRAGGGTNLEAGMRAAEAMVADVATDGDRETRVVYVTDAMPNLGETSGEALHSRLKAMADAGVYSTFVGVGVDFNPRLVERINAVPGANHYVVESASAFRERMDEGFDYMVTPLVFDLTLTVESDAYDVEAVYGSPDADPATGEMLHVHTLFPSRKTENGTEGGVVLVRVNRTDPEADPALALTASYETRDGERETVERTVSFDGLAPGTYDTTGVRKAVALGRYVDLMHNWLAYEREAAAGDPEEPASGIERRERPLGEWEQRSTALRVSPVYAERIAAFRDYFAAERDALDDPTLDRELDVLSTLLAAADPRNAEASSGDGAESAGANATA